MNLIKLRTEINYMHIIFIKKRKNQLNAQLNQLIIFTKKRHEGKNFRH